MTNVANGFEVVMAAFFLIYWYFIVLPNVFWYFYDKSELSINGILVRNVIFIVMAAVFLCCQGSLRNLQWVMNFRGLLLLTGFLAAYGLIYVFIYFLPMCNIVKNQKMMSCDFESAVWRRNILHSSAWLNFWLVLILVILGLCFFNWDYIDFNP